MRLALYMIVLGVLISLALGSGEWIKSISRLRAEILSPSSNRNGDLRRYISRANELLQTLENAPVILKSKNFQIPAEAQAVEDSLTAACTFLQGHLDIPGVAVLQDCISALRLLNRREPERAFAVLNQPLIEQEQWINQGICIDEEKWIKNVKNLCISIKQLETSNEGEDVLKVIGSTNAILGTFPKPWQIDISKKPNQKSLRLRLCGATVFLAGRSYPPGVKLFQDCVIALWNVVAGHPDNRSPMWEKYSNPDRNDPSTSQPTNDSNNV
jgi:hypothetical protein